MVRVERTLGLSRGVVLGGKRGVVMGVHGFVVVVMGSVVASRGKVGALRIRYGRVSKNGRGRWEEVVVMFRIETPWMNVVCRVGGSVETVRVVSVSYGGV